MIKKATKKSKRLIQQTMWIVKRKEDNDIYTLSSFFWTRYQAERHLRESINGCYKYHPEEDYEVIKVKVNQI